MRSLRIIIALLVCVYAVGRASAEEARRKVLLVGDSTPTSDTLSFPGLSVLPSRPQGAMVEILESSWETFLQSHADAVLLAEEDLLYLPGMTVDTQISSTKRTKMETGGNRLRIIQFHNPPTEADEDDLAQRGLKVLQPIPTNALLVLAPTGKENDLPTTGSLVRFVGHLPKEVVKAAVADLTTSSTLDAEGRAPVFVCAADDPTVNQSIASWLAANPTVDSAGEANEGGVIRYRLRMTPEQIESIASVDGAMSITTAAAGIVYLDEMQSLIVDNQLTTAGESGVHAPQRPYVPAVTPAPPGGKFNSHLTFLASKLDDVGPNVDNIPAWRRPNSYPILTVIDVGIGDGNPLMPQRGDFYLEGLKDPKATGYDFRSRNMFEFRSFWQFDTIIPEPPNAKPEQVFHGPSHPTLLYETLAASQGEYSFNPAAPSVPIPTRHGTGVTSGAVGYPDQQATSNVDDASGLTRTLGVSPYGRFACAEQGGIIMPVGLGSWDEATPRLYQPEDTLRIVGEIHRRQYWTDAESAIRTQQYWVEDSRKAVLASQTAITNNSWLLMPSDNNYNLSRDSNRYTVMFDKLTRDSRPKAPPATSTPTAPTPTPSDNWFPDDPDGVRCQTLFVAAAGNFGPVYADQPPKGGAQIGSGMAIPGIAKNVLTVGGSESVTYPGFDGLQPFPLYRSSGTTKTPVCFRQQTVSIGRSSSGEIVAGQENLTWPIQPICGSSAAVANLRITSITETTVEIEL